MIVSFTGHDMRRRIWPHLVVHKTTELPDSVREDQLPSFPQLQPITIKQECE